MAQKKEFHWPGTALKDLKAFPDDVKRLAGYQLDRVQNGELPTDWKPMPTVGSGAKEIRIREAGNAYRVFYIVETKTGVYVLHAFQKKTQKTETKDISLAKRRYNEIEGAI